MSPVHVQLASRTGIAVAAVSGEVDLDERDRFEQALGPIRHGSGPAVLDLEAVPFMDSTGLHVVVALCRSLQREGRSLVLAGPRQAVRNLFELTSLDRMMAIYDDVEAAVEAVRRGEQRPLSADAS